MADDEECTEETWSWWHFKPEQVDPYWIRCGLTFPHDEHEDSNTGLTWKKEPVEPDEYLAVRNATETLDQGKMELPTVNEPALTQDDTLVDSGQGFLALEIHPNQLQDSFLITSDTPLSMQRIVSSNQTSEKPFPTDRFVTEPHPDPEHVGPFMASKENTNYPERARALVFDFIKDRLEKTDNHVTFSIDEVYTVWFCKTLKNWKGLFSTTLPDGMYYEVTYDGAEGRAYIDKYTKVDNVMVLDSTLY